MELDLDDLEAKCRAATPGPWTQDLCQVGKEWLKGRIQNCVVNDAGVVAIVSESDPDADYIAAANPAVTLELIAQLRKARESVPALLNLVADIQGLMSESEGVAGLHRNGDVAPWDELEPGGRYERLGSLQAAIEVINKAEA